MLVRVACALPFHARVKCREFALQTRIARSENQPEQPERSLMSHALVIDLARNAALTALLLAAPMLVVALGVGLLVSVLQAVTQIQEQTLSFVPKLVAVAVIFLVALPWMIQLATRYAGDLFRSIPTLAA